MCLRVSVSPGVDPDSLPALFFCSPLSAPPAGAPIAASIGITSTGGVAAGAATIQKTASSVSQRAAMPGLPLQPLQERRQQIHRQRKYDGRILVRADDRERFQVTQLDCLRLLRQDL